MAVLHCVITSPEGLIFEGDARFIVVPAVDGEMGVLPRHAPMIAALGGGEIRVEPAAGGGRKRFFVDGGFVQVLKNQVTLLGTEVEPLDGMERAKAQARLDDLLRSSPAAGANLEERDAFQEKVRVSRRRLKLVG